MPPVSSVTFGMFDRPLYATVSSKFKRRVELIKYGLWYGSKSKLIVMVLEIGLATCESLSDHTLFRMHHDHIIVDFKSNALQKAVMKA